MLVSSREKLAYYWCTIAWNFDFITVFQWKVCTFCQSCWFEKESSQDLNIFMLLKIRQWAKSFLKFSFCQNWNFDFKSYRTFVTSLCQILSVSLFVFVKFCLISSDCKFNDVTFSPFDKFRWWKCSKMNLVILCVTFRGRHLNLNVNVQQVCDTFRFNLLTILLCVFTPIECNHQQQLRKLLSAKLLIQSKRRIKEKRKVSDDFTWKIFFSLCCVLPKLPNYYDLLHHLDDDCKEGAFVSWHFHFLSLMNQRVILSFLMLPCLIWLWRVMVSVCVFAGDQI